MNLNNITDNRKFWKTVKPLFGDKGGTTDKIVLVEENKIINEDAEVAQTFNNFFENAVKSLGISENKLLLTEVGHSCGKVLDAIKMYESHPSILKIKENVVVETEFSFSPVSLEEIHSELKMLNTRKAIPYMNIPPKQLKEVMNIIDKPLQGIWNSEILVNKKFPSKLKLADISPIHKKLQTVLKSNYRPVSVLPVVSKIFERIMDKQTNDYFSDRWQRTKINTSFSSWSLIMCGMAQGSVLGPKYFNIYINDLFFLFIYSDICNMADDTTPYVCDIDLPSLIHNLQGDVASVISWFEANYLILNPDKCHFLISGPKTVVEQMSIEVGDQVIWESLEEKLLGVTIDKKLKFDSYLNNICKKAAAKVTALTRLAKIMPFEKKRILMNAFIESQFSYCPLVWMFCSRTMNNTIKCIHKRALRLVYLDYVSSFEELLKKDKSVTIHQRNIQLLAIEMFKVVKGLGPEITKSLFHFDKDTRSERSFLRPNVNSVNNGKNSIRYFGPIVWDDMLPSKLKSIQTLQIFKSEIKKWDPVNCPCTLCKEYIGGVGMITTFE